MPKSFSDTEKAYIQSRLLQEAETCLALYGIRKTTVDELIHRVGIPKGTFYLFYASKEALIFDVLLKLNTDIQQKLVTSISALQQKPGVEELTQIIFDLYQSLDESFLLRLIENGELQFLMQKAPPEFLEINVLEDNAMADRLLSLFPQATAEKAELFSAALRGTFLLLLHKKEIAYDFNTVLRLSIRGIILQMFGEES